MSISQLAANLQKWTGLKATFASHPGNFYVIYLHAPDSSMAGVFPVLSVPVREEAPGMWTILTSQTYPIESSCRGNLQGLIDAALID